jgi:hypothetical protein
MSLPTLPDPPPADPAHGNRLGCKSRATNGLRELEGSVDQIGRDGKAAGRGAGGVGSAAETAGAAL